MEFQTLDKAEVRGRRVLLRVDLNVPVRDGQVSDTTRIERVKGTILELADKGAKVILLAHFGRPKGKPVSEFSLKQILPAVERVLGRSVSFADDCIGDVARNAVAALPDGGILLLENTRFHAEEEKNDSDFVKALAANGDIYVNDAFSAAHRAHASTEGLAHILPSFAGRSMQAELEALEKGLESPKKPVMAIVGGAKVSTKIDLLNNLITKVDSLVIGGGMANTFLAAKGVSVGKSLCEHDLAETARAVMAKAEQGSCKIILPVDAVVAAQFAANMPTQHCEIGAVPDDMMILDIGDQAIASINAALENTETLVWNGPLGAFEIPPFDKGTVSVARKAAELTKAGRLISVAGGGDTVSALNHAGIAADFTYLSTAGGAFLEWLEGKPLPGVLALGNSAAG